jgi:hypothetical protein
MNRTLVLHCSGLRVDGVGSLLHHGDYFYSLRYDRCGHTATGVAARRELEQTVKKHYGPARRALGRSDGSVQAVRCS